MCSLLALVTNMATERTHWMNDNEDPERVNSLIKGIGSYFSTMLKQDDQTLGLGATSCKEEQAASRRNLYCWLTQ